KPKAINIISRNIEKFKGYNIVLETKITDYTELEDATMIAEERLKEFRKLLINDFKINPSLITSRIINKNKEDMAVAQKAVKIIDLEKGKDHGWIAIIKQ
ncbi:MAG: hypothetical protein LBQ34_06465, partial [Alphaproteobacteria bacterium]|nr:hypothetical protein [Alphaproteobacteria bacterium]